MATTDDPPTGFKGAKNMIPLHLGQAAHWHIGFGMSVERLELGHRGAQYAVRRKDDGSFDEVLQFPNVPWPGVSHQRIDRLGRDIVDSLVHPLSVERGEVPGQLGNVLGALAQSRNVDGKHVQAVEQVLAKCSLLDHGAQISMRGGDDADVDLVRMVATKPLEFLLLQDPKQFCLEFERNVADFVEKERALVRQFEASRFLGDRPRKGSLFVHEELALQETERDRGTIQLDESSLPPPAQIVDGARNEFFAGSRLAQDQDARIRRGDHGHQVQRGMQGGTVADDSPKIGTKFLFEIGSVRRLFVPVLRGFLVVQAVFNGNGDLTSHLVEKGHLILSKSSLRTAQGREHADHPVSADQGQIASGLQAFRHDSRQEALTLAVSEGLGIVAHLLEIVDVLPLARPKRLPAWRAHEGHESAVGNGATGLGIVESGDPQLTAVSSREKESAEITPGDAQQMRGQDLQYSREVKLRGHAVGDFEKEAKPIALMP